MISEDQRFAANVLRATVVAAVVEEGGVAAKPAETFRAECLNSRMKRSNVWQVRYVSVVM